GEIAAMAVADCVCRMVPGVLADEACYTGESHWDGLLEYPQYTRPEVWEGRAVPEVLRGGNHAEIETWRRQKSLERTMDKRPDLFRAFCPDAADQKLIARIQKQRSRRKLSHPAVCRAAAEDDLAAILEIVRQAKNYLRRHRVDQWQGEYPAEAVFRADIARGECYVLDYDGEVAGMFTLSAQPEPAYAALTDGKWRSGEDYCVLHRNAVRADFRGTGVSDTMLQAVEALTRQHGCTAVRVDTHRKNKGQLRLLKAHGYRYCGNILIDSEPGHDPKRQAFEKILKMQAF
ncbi:MAG: GNAT family N-acetyltransferase, partial [Clostridiales bacterium]|nr:GNAT family N-acetyltransferase [Clostridiales bacterium]